MDQQNREEEGKASREENLGAGIQVEDQAYLEAQMALVVVAARAAPLQKISVPSNTFV